MLIRAITIASIAAAGITIGTWRTAQEAVMASAEPELPLKKADRLNLFTPWIEPQAAITDRWLAPVAAPRTDAAQTVGTTASVRRHRTGCAKRWFKRHGHRYWRCRR